MGKPELVKNATIKIAFVFVFTFMFLVLLSGCASQSVETGSNVENEPEFADFMLSEDITISVPSSWRGVEGSTDVIQSYPVYFYPYSDSSAMLQISRTDISDLMAKTPEEYITDDERYELLCDAYCVGALEAFEDVAENNTLDVVDKTLVNNITMHYARFIYPIDSSNYDTKVYIFIDKNNNYSYLVGFMMKDALSEEMGQLFEEIISSIKMV